MTAEEKTTHFNKTLCCKAAQCTLFVCLAKNPPTHKALFLSKDNDIQLSLSGSQITPCRVVLLSVLYTVSILYTEMGMNIWDRETQRTSL